MSHDEHDRLIDDELRAVPLPPGLLDRLRAVKNGSATELVDQDIDDLLLAVHVPMSVTIRVHDAIADEELDAQLRNVDPPATMLARVRIIPEIRRRSRLRLLALAASLMLMLTLGFWGSGAAMLTLLKPAEDPAVELTFVYDGPLEIRAEPVVVEVVPNPGIESIVTTPTRTEATDDQIAVPRVLGDHASLLASWNADVSGGLDPWQEVMLLKWNVLGAPPASEQIAMQTVSFPEPKGIVLPIAAGYDRGFLYSKHVHPPMFVANNEHLKRAALPLTMDASSYVKLQSELAQGRLLDVEEVRVEEFLAAFDYQLAAPERLPLGIRAAAGPALFGDGRSQMLQVSLQARNVMQASAAGTHLVVALDVSSSMAWDNRLDRVQTALQTVYKQLGPRDYFSLVAFNETILVDIDGATKDDQQAVMRAIAQLAPRGGTNVSDGLSRAFSLANASMPAGGGKRVVLITDGDLDVDDTVLEPLVGMAAELHASDVQLQLLHVGSFDENRTLEALARAADTQVIATPNSKALADRLTFALLGSSSTIATEAEMTVTFNPQAVDAYRLIGHEANALSLVEPTRVKVDVPVGEQATGLYEVWLRPTDDELVATVTLTWKDPSSGKLQQQTQRISRLQFATSWEECALSLQLAQVVAETAEVLRGGYTFEVSRPGGMKTKRKPRGVRHVLETVDRWNPLLLERDEVRGFVEVLKTIQVTSGGGRR